MKLSNSTIKELEDPDGIMQFAECEKCSSHEMSVMSLDCPNPAVILYGFCQSCGAPFKLFFGGKGE